MTRTKKEKQEFEDIKKTVEAHGTLSEDEAAKKAEDSGEVSQELIEKPDSKPLEDVQEIKPEGRRRFGERTKEEVVLAWAPKTKLGMDVKNGKITTLDEIIDKKMKILEPEIVDYLINLKSDLLSIGQSKGKFGGGKRRAWRQTQRKTEEGNVPTFSTMAVVGDENGHVGIGTGKAKETLPARDKATRHAKLGIMKVTRKCSDFDCACNDPHTIPFKVTGKGGSVRVTLIPAPQGTGLVVANELKKVLKLAGIKDIRSRTSGKQRTTFNLAKACIDALNKTNLKIGEKNVSNN
ncbi:30S ribosomal protein S5 [Candidatus Pacearchaeota archaeon]|nr:30S ribosomal protein S5 [Candidatus Pacearchaeota archaeon]